MFADARCVPLCRARIARALIHLAAPGFAISAALTNMATGAIMMLTLVGGCLLTASGNRHDHQGATAWLRPHLVSVVGPDLSARTASAAHHDGMTQFATTPPITSAAVPARSLRFAVAAPAPEALVLVTDFDPHVVESTPPAPADFAVADLAALVAAHDFSAPVAPVAPVASLAATA